MDDLISLDMEFYTEESFREYVNKKSPIHNEKLRGDNETIFDALSSSEADFVNDPEYQELVSNIRDYK